MVTPVVVINCQIKMTDPEVEGITLVEIGGLRSTKEIEFAIACKMSGVADVTPDQSCEPAAPGGKMERAGMGCGHIGKWNVLPGCRDIGADKVIAGNGRQLKKTAGGDCHPVYENAVRANVGIAFEFRLESGKTAGLIGRGLPGKTDSNGRQHGWLWLAAARNFRK